MNQLPSLSKKSRTVPLYREWRVPDPPEPLIVERFCREVPLPSEVAAVLLRRSGGDGGKARLIREPHAIEIPDVLDLPGMRGAALRIAGAISKGERIVAYSDFDADGVTSAAIVKEALELAGAPEISVYFPSRFTEGYGFHACSVREIAAGGACLIITSDCGIAAFDGCEEAARAGCDVIVTDHHLPRDELPRAHSVLNPHVPSWAPYDLTELTGAGVAYLLALALFHVTGIEVPSSWAHDLLAISVAADGYPVLGLNRAWAASGLAEIEEAKRPGIAALLEVAGIYQAGGERRRLSFDRDVTFGIVPRLNAAGRLKDARLAFDILVETDPIKAKALALELDRLNQERRGIEEGIMEECMGDLVGEAGGHYAVCAYRPEWHEGVLGIAASKVREAFGRPAALAGGSGDFLKGSVRGIPGFNVVEALSRCAGLLEAFGGHEAAGGFTVRRDSVDAFFDAFRSVTAELLSGVSIAPALDLDEVLTLEQVREEVLRGFFDLEPFGKGNPLPQVVSMDCEVQEVSRIGKTRDHLEVTLSKDGVSRRFLWFGRGKEAREIALMGRVDVAFTPYRSVYLGAEEVTPLIRDIRPSWERSGAGYSCLVEMASGYASHSSSLIYTWSPDAAEAIWAAARKMGKPAAVHLEGQTRVQSHEARVILGTPGGVVITNAPWELACGAEAVPSAGMVLAHLPVSESHLSLLLDFMSRVQAPSRVWSEWERDSENWLSWTYPQKDTLGLMWKSLKKRSSGGRAKLSELARRSGEICVDAGFSDASPGSFEGHRLFLERSLQVLEELGMVEYGESRRVPEIIFCRAGERILLADSPSYAEGKAIWEEARETRQRAIRVLA